MTPNADDVASALMVELAPSCAETPAFGPAARLPGDTFEPFEKDGFVWIGRIGLKFNDRGQLIEVSRAWD